MGQAAGHMDRAISGMFGAPLSPPDRPVLDGQLLYTTQLMVNYTTAGYVFSAHGMSFDHCGEMCRPLLDRHTRLVYEDETKDAYIAIDPALEAIILSIRGAHALNLGEWTNVGIGTLHQVPFDARVIQEQISHHPSLKCFVVGISKGAALATLLAARLFERLGTAFPGRDWEHDLHLYAWGSPRVGNQAWADYFDSLGVRNVVRYVNGFDMVPHMPPKSEGFVHVSGEMWEWRPGSIAVCRGQEDPGCSQQVTPRAALNPFKSVGLHLTMLGRMVPKFML